MNFQGKLDKIVKKNNSLVCVGLDSDLTRLRRSAAEAMERKWQGFDGRRKLSQFEFNKWIIGQTHDMVCTYKPNPAFYEAQGAEGIEQLKLTCDYLRKNYPKIPIILDAKRGDIGSTNEGYVKYAFEYLGVDGITLHPYLGREALVPFLDRKDKGCIILCRTSNPGAGEFQDYYRQKPLYEYVAEQVIKKWNKNKNCMLVVGATYPKELKEIREIVGDMTLLVPGIGVQGGDVKKTVKAGLNSKKAGMIINSSRGIIFAKNPRGETKNLRDEINKYRFPHSPQ